MLRKLIFSTLLLSTLVFHGCSKKDNGTNPPLPETPIAKAQYDTSNFGIYKGVFVGSSGTIIIDISNSDAITATLEIDNVTYNFTTNQTIQINQPTTLTFSSGENSFTFTVAANGANPTITNLVMNGHDDPALLVVKETSTAIVKCYEGTFTGEDNGIFNAVTYDDKIKALIKSSKYHSNFIATGTVSNHQITATGTVTGGATFTGTIDGNTASGTWINESADLNGTWSGALAD